LVIPEINASDVKTHEGIIANPNCTTAVTLMALYPLHRAFSVKRIFASSYQAVSGTGAKAIEELRRQIEQSVNGKHTTKEVYPHQIAFNVLPHVDSFLPSGYTKEEMKMVNETRKIMRDDTIRVTATTVRIPVMGGHSESVNVEFEKEFDLQEVKALLSRTPGVIVTDDPARQQYPMPKDAHEKDEVFVGRLRRDETQAKTLNMWVVSDNLRKGAATNAVQIAEYLVTQKLI